MHGHGNTMRFPTVSLYLPNWVEPFVRETGTVFHAIEDRMRFVIQLSRQNIDRRTGGPFGAAVFERESGRLVAPGVNLVIPSACSTAHAEIVAISTAQQVAGTYDLGDGHIPQSELVTATEPCAMCLGAIVWSGISRVVCGARDEDAREIGFDEGPKPADWVQELENRGIAVLADILRQEARSVLLSYAASGEPVYNARQRHVT